MAILPPPRAAGNSAPIPRPNPLMTPSQRARLLAQLTALKLGRPRPPEDDSGIPFIPDIVQDATGQIADALIHTPHGFVHMGKEIGKDLGGLARGDFVPEHTAGLGVDMARSIKEDFTNPRENIGYLLMDLFGLASWGAGTGVRAVGTVGRSRGKFRDLRGGEGGSSGSPSPLLPPDAPVPAGAAPIPPPSPGEMARATAEAVRATTRERIVPTADPFAPKLGYQQRRLEGFPADALAYQAPARVAPEVEAPLVDPLQKSLFSDVGGQMPPIGFNQQISFTRERQLLDPDFRVLSQSIRPPLQPGLFDDRPLPAINPDGTPMNLPPEIPELAAQTAGKGELRPRNVDIDPDTGEPVKAKHVPASSLVRIFADRKTKRLEIDERDTALNMRPVREGGSVRWQLFDADQPLSPVVKGYKAAKDILGEAYLAQKGGSAPDSPLFEKVVDAPPADAMTSLMQAIDAAKQPKQKAVTRGEGRFKAKLVPGEGWAVIDTEKAGSQHKVYTFNKDADASIVKKNEAALARIQALRKKKGKTDKEKAELKQRERVEVELKAEARTHSLTEDLAKTQALEHARRLNEAKKKTPEAEIEPFSRENAEVPVPRKLTREEARKISKDEYDLLLPNQKAWVKSALDEREQKIIARTERNPENIPTLAQKAALAEVDAKRAELFDDVKPVGEKPEKVTKRDLGDTQRGQKLNPRDLGVSQKQLEDYGLSKAQAQEITRRLAPELRTLWKEAVAAGKEKPTRKAIHEALVKHVGEDLAKKITTRMMKVKGGANIPMSVYLRAVRDAFKESAPARTYELTREVEVTKKLGSATKPGFPEGKMPKPLGRGGKLQVTRKETERVKVPLSRNPLVAEAQKTLYKLYEKSAERGTPILGRRLDRRFEFEKREIGRIARLLEASGQINEERFRDAARDAVKRPIKKDATIGDYADTFNQATKIGLLFLKPAYVPANLLGQIAITLADHAFNPVNLARSWKLSMDITRGKAPAELQKLTRKMDDAMQQGFIDAIAYEKGAVKPIGVVYERAADRFSKILDTPFRRATFFHEARRQGFDTPEKVAKLLDAKKGTAEWDTLIDVSRRANRNIIDYGRMGKNEKAWVRRIVFFYPWMKGATIYGAHFLSEHSAQGLTAVQQGKLADERSERELGPVPSYLEGVFKIGETDVPGLGKMPKVINPASASVLGTPGEALNFARSLIGGNVEEADQPAGFLTPAVTAAFAAFSRSDPLTGRDYPASASTLGIIYNELKKTVAPVRFKENLDKAKKIKAGELDARDILFPGGEGEAVGRYVLGSSPVTLNTREARERAFAERRSLQDKRQREISRHNDYRKIYLDAARAHGMAGPKENLPDSVKRAFTARAQRYANRAALEVELDRELRPVDRLRSDLDLLVRQGKLDAQRASTILVTLGTMDTDTINRFLRNLGEAFFGSDVLSAYRAALNDRGAEITVP